MRVWVVDLRKYCIKYKTHFSPVSQSDINILERKLLLTVDMILVKKKRIAVDKRHHKPATARTGIWGMISSVTQRPPGAESSFPFFFITDF